jgi:hypothetical protein
VLWVIGSPRSGTTLLRNVLNTHPDIALCSFESKFVPSLISTYGSVGALQDPAMREAVRRRIMTSRLYLNGQEEWGWTPTEDAVDHALSGATWTDVLRDVLDLWCAKDMTAAQVWGDNTATYSDHIDVITRAVPQSRFVQIIRDPRDRAASEHAIWGRSYARSAHSWAARIVAARHSQAAQQDRYYELTFEDLLTEPNRTLSALADWLGLPVFEWQTDEVPVSDQLGQSVGLRRIEPAVIDKRRASLSPRSERRIAALSGDVATTLGYQLPPVPQRRLRPPELWMYRQYDRLALSRYYLRAWGPRRALAKIRATARDVR